MYSSRRTFEKLNDVLHGLPFSINKIFHSTSTVFDGIIYARRDRQRVIAELELNEDREAEKSRWKMDSREMRELLCGVSSGHLMHLVRGVSFQKTTADLTESQIQLMSIPDNLETLRERRFCTFLR